MPTPPYRLAHAAWAAAASLLPWSAAQGQTQVAAANLADLSLEQLSNIEVTSVSKRPQRLAEVSATVYVISN